jgi:hypothetical protein
MMERASPAELVALDMTRLAMALNRTHATRTPHRDEVHQIFEEERQRTDIGAVKMPDIMALFIAVGLWFYATSGERMLPPTTGRPHRKR